MRKSGTLTVWFDELVKRCAYQETGEDVTYGLPSETTGVVNGITADYTPQDRKKHTLCVKK